METTETGIDHKPLSSFEVKCEYLPMAHSWRRTTRLRGEEGDVAVQPVLFTPIAEGVFRVTVEGPGAWEDAEAVAEATQHKIELTSRGRESGSLAIVMTVRLESETTIRSEIKVR